MAPVSAEIDSVVLRCMEKDATRRYPDVGAFADALRAAVKGGHAAGAEGKRGVAYDLASPNDLAALSPGVSWWYNWSLRPNAGRIPWWILDAGRRVPGSQAETREGDKRDGPGDEHELGPDEHQQRAAGQSWIHQIATVEPCLKQEH